MSADLSIADPIANTFNIPHVDNDQDISDITRIDLKSNNDGNFVTNWLGISELEYQVYTGEPETDALVPSNGFSLWLVYLIVHAFRGSVRFEENKPSQSIVTIEQPSATQQKADSARKS